MPHFRVECACRDTGDNYMVLVDAATAADAVDAASHHHIVSGTAPTAVDADPVTTEIRMLRDQLSRNNRSSQRNTAVGVFFGILAVGLLFLFLFFVLPVAVEQLRQIPRGSAVDWDADNSLGQILSNLLAMLAMVSVVLWIAVYWIRRAMRRIRKRV